MDAHIGSVHREYSFTTRAVADNLARVIYHLENADADLARSAMPKRFFDPELILQNAGTWTAERVVV